MAPKRAVANAKIGRGGSRRPQNRAVGDLRGKQSSVKLVTQPEMDDGGKGAKKARMEEAVSDGSDSEEEVGSYRKLLSMLKAKAATEDVVTSDECGSEEDESGEEEESLEEEDSEGEEPSIEEAEAEDESESEEETAVSEEVEDNQEGDAAKPYHELEEDEEEKNGPNSDNEDQDNADTDTFHLHCERDLTDELVATLSSPKPYEIHILNWKSLGRLIVQTPAQTAAAVADSCSAVKKTQKLLDDDKKPAAKPGTVPSLKCGSTLREWGFRSQLCENLKAMAPAGSTGDAAEDILPPVQHELLYLLNEYRDVHLNDQNADNDDQLRSAYCSHVLNHVLKSRDKVLHHNTKLKKAREDGAEPPEYRDQGLVRPRVLILAPMRNIAVKIVEMLGKLLLPQKGHWVNKKRFYEEFSVDEDDDQQAATGKTESAGEAGEQVKPARMSRKPHDHQHLFAGNTDDSFRIGLAVSKRTLKLYSGFYESDILIGSPLGLRTLLDDDFDFLSSVEILVMERADVFYMQNWEHVIQVMQHLHLQPRQQHGTDLGRVRLWSLNGWSAHYRQNVILSAIPLVELTSLNRLYGTNFSGKIRQENAVASGSVCRIVVQLPQAFHRLPSAAAATDAQDRFEFFTRRILPQYRDALMTNTLVYIPSYYDYVRLRNYLHKQEVQFGQACEYTPDGQLAQVRNRFFVGKRRLLLYTERLHFYRRLTVKGIHHIIFYQLPTYPHFYAELCNLLHDNYQSKRFRGDSSQTCTVLYSTYDAVRLAGAVGSQRAAQMLASDRPVHLLVSGEN